jgi:hypothetical protein
MSFVFAVFFNVLQRATGDCFPFLALRYAANPATWGADNDVPSKKAWGKVSPNMSERTQECESGLR